MPHIVIEYSANLEGRIDPAQLVRSAHAAALGTGVFKLGAVRTRAARRDVALVADGDPANAFVAVAVRIGTGRPEQTRRALGQAIFDAVCRDLDDIFSDTPLGISLEVVEVDEAASFKKNNLHVRMEGKEVRIAS